MSAPILDAPDLQTRVILRKEARGEHLTPAENARLARRMFAEGETLRAGGSLKGTIQRQSPSAYDLGQADQQEADDYLRGRQFTGTEAAPESSTRSMVGRQTRGGDGLSPGARAIVNQRIADSEKARKDQLRADPTKDEIKTLNERRAGLRPLRERGQQELKNFLASDAADIFERDLLNPKQFKRDANGDFVISSRFGRDLVGMRTRARNGDANAQKEVAALEDEYRAKRGRFEPIAKSIAAADAEDRSIASRLAELSRQRGQSASLSNGSPVAAFSSVPPPPSLPVNPFSLRPGGSSLERTRTDGMAIGLDGRPYNPRGGAVVDRGPSVQDRINSNGLAGFQVAPPMEQTAAGPVRRLMPTAEETAAGMSVSYDPQPGIPDGYGVLQGADGTLRVSGPGGLMLDEKGERRRFATMNDVNTFFGQITQANRPEASPSAAVPRLVAGSQTKPPAPSTPSRAPAQPAPSAEGGFSDVAIPAAVAALLNPGQTWAALRGAATLGARGAAQIVPLARAGATGYAIGTAINSLPRMFGSDRRLSDMAVDSRMGRYEDWMKEPVQPTNPAPASAGTAGPSGAWLGQGGMSQPGFVRPEAARGLPPPVVRLPSPEEVANAQAARPATSTLETSLMMPPSATVRNAFSPASTAPRVPAPMIDTSGPGLPRSEWTAPKPAPVIDVTSPMRDSEPLTDQSEDVDRFNPFNEPTRRRRRASVLSE